ncbi:PepSY domain-containing protein [Halomonas sp. McH1-25]|uniref:PepSY-associated TM helix domain-containing protein n=1 Tax=unclassified Halomonas TaxID=2609666 RepID=UPI001EF4CE70|nr:MULTISPECIES: PepSY domain-containing protein [unclassified Halomonas]MCG7599794.1 PepSY domain-containing protein [Halomonas sp. McH1-25]MCP1341689.1 PepSY domain-containing protein [Halomonas sp. FL8]MCP1359847.1 PepSY domain-containing protein [Halomonas sp. BBD45]MCP1365284.1 PepSY domain-containing protein [Halomonas sp. BBD48]
MSRTRRDVNDLYRAVWRWHFYAGLIALPFLILLAVTGALYLFKDEVEQWWYADTLRVEAQSTPPASAQAQLNAALAAQPGKAFRYVTPATPDLATEIDIRTADGDKRAVYVDPYSGDVTGSLPYRGSVMWTIRQLHSLSYFGTTASMIIEIVAGWTILLVLTGLYLWWPRGQRGGVVSVRSRPSKRLFWRDLHAVTGVFVGGFILFLAVTGMPWSAVWGSKVNELANGNNFGYPDGVRVNVPMSDARLAERELTPWSLEQAQLPASAESDTSAIGLDRAIARFDALELTPGYAVSLPSAASDVYTGSIYPDDLSQQRVVHLDQYTGEPLLDMSYADYGPLGQTLEWGVNVHLGQEFGIVNQVVLALVCAGIVLLCVASGVMWWMRRPTGRLGVPPAPQDPRKLRGVLALLAIGGVIFPLVGASMIVMATIDAGIRYRSTHSSTKAVG